MMLFRNTVEARKTNVKCSFEKKNRKNASTCIKTDAYDDRQCLDDDDGGVLYNNIIYYYESRAAK